MENEIKNITDPNVIKLLNTAIQMQKEYDFYIPPLFENIDILEKDFDSKVKKIASDSREEYLRLLNELDAASAFTKVEITPQEARTFLENAK